MAYHRRRLLLDYSLVPEGDSVFFFNFEQIRLGCFSQPNLGNDSHLHVDLQELLVVDIKVVLW